MRIASFILAFLVIAFHLEAAPAPIYRGLPEEVKNLVEAYTITTPKMMETTKRRIVTARTKEEQDLWIRDLELLQRECYCKPVTILQNVLKDPRYQSHRDQEAIQRALEKYRDRYQDAKMRKLFKPEQLTEAEKAARLKPQSFPKQRNPLR